ncbi:acyltransferase family protein [Glutamicibacter nicotianae]|uniref:acyltransferase family protein n=1 Tax=Glutamicibacter nicotianae TaxID=37929 RepID=UPI000EF94133|nr:acyltransferase [Glutamicibacter nicotianae]
MQQALVPSGPIQYVSELDGIRALAVLAVMVFHARGSLMPGGFIGVDVFFVLSGYLITQILMREYDKHAKVSLVNFYMRRALRLLPALFAASAVLFALYTLFPSIPESQASKTGILGALTYSASWLAALDIADLGTMLPTWSLSVEEHFYLIWPVCFLLLIRGSRRWRQFTWIPLILACFYPVVLYVAFGASIERIYYAPDTRAFQLLIGCALAMNYRRLRRFISTPVFILSVAFLALFVFFENRLNFNSYAAGAIILVPVASAAIVVHVVERRSRIVSQFLSLRPLVWVGQRSYGIYLWNVPLIGLLWFLGDSPAALAAKLVACFAIPGLSYALLERPCLRLKDRWRQRADRSRSMEAQPE